MAEVWLNNQFTRFIARCTKTNVNPVSNVFHSLTKDAVIHLFEEILLKLIGPFCSQWSVLVDVLLQPSALFEFDTPMVLGNS